MGLSTKLQVALIAIFMVDMVTSIHRIVQLSGRHSHLAATTVVRSMTGPYTYQYPRPSLTVDAAIVARPQRPERAKLLLIQRKHDPFQGSWALPGGFVDENEPLDKAAARELQEETSVDPSSVPLVQVGAFGDPGRDPRGWCVTAAYVALVPTTELGAKAADDAAAVRWFALDQLPALAFDHKLVVRESLSKLATLPEARDDEALQQDLDLGIQALQGPWN